MKQKLPKKIKGILAEIKQCLKSIYGENLKDIMLFGSFARGDFIDGSDIDIIILLEKMREHVI